MINFLSSKSGCIEEDPIPAINAFCTTKGDVVEV
jgi:hypothetical protein